MCLGVPGRVVELAHDASGMGRVDFGGLRKAVSLLCVPEAGIGDYVMVHAGFAIARIDEEEARGVLALLDELDAFEPATAPPLAPRGTP